LEEINNKMIPFSQVIAFICGVIVVVLMIMALASTDWLMAAGWRQGLFVHCIEEDSMPPLPFNIQDPPGCYWTRDIGMDFKTINSNLIFIIILYNLQPTLRPPQHSALSH